jgi:hypothetical protein
MMSDWQQPELGPATMLVGRNVLRGKVEGQHLRDVGERHALLRARLFKRARCPLWSC